MRKYPLLHNDVTVGTVMVEQEGMYYRITCTCNTDDLTDHHIYAKTEKDSILLGKCAIRSDGVMLQRFIPIKKLGNGILLFNIKGAQNKEMITLDPHVEFPAIAMLPNGRFCMEGSSRGIVFQNEKEC